MVNTLGPCLSMLGCAGIANNGSIAPSNVVLHESSCKLVPDRRGFRGREVQLRAYGLGGRPSPAEPKPAIGLGDWGRRCKLRPEADFFIYPAECYGLQSSLGRFQLLFGIVLFHLFYEST